MIPFSGATPPSYTPTGYYSYYSPQPNQRPNRKCSTPLQECQTLPSGATLDGGGNGSPWKRKLSTTLKTMVSSPRFGRRKFEGSPENSTSTSPSQS